MSLDNIQLPASVIADLFKDSLVDLAGHETRVASSGSPVGSMEREETSSESRVASGELAFLGNNKRSITIIVHDPNSIYLEEDQLKFLLGILGACKLSMEDIALVNFAKQEGLEHQQIKQSLSPGICFLFGMKADAIKLPLSFPDYQAQTFDKTVYLTAPSLTALESNKEEKVKLWTSLKKIFSI